MRAFIIIYPMYSEGVAHLDFCFDLPAVFDD